MKIFNVHAFSPAPTRPKEKYDGHQYYNIFLFKQTKTLTLTGLCCRSLQILSYAASTQNQWFWTTISFSFHQAKSNMSVLQKKFFQKETKMKIKTETSQVTSRINLWSLLHVQSFYITICTCLFHLKLSKNKIMTVSNWILVSRQPHRVSLGSQFISYSLVCSCLGLFVVHECSAALSCIVKFSYHTWRACLCQCRGAWNTK